MKLFPYCAGHFEEAGEVQNITSPWDDSQVGEVTLASPDLPFKAIQSARGVAKQQFALPRHEKSRQCEAIASGISAAKDELANLIMRESGKPLRYARGEVDRAVVTFTLASHEALRFTGEELPLDITPAGNGLVGFSKRVPLGPVAAIAPFNFPLNLVAHKIAPALAVGVPIILKPAVQTPLTALKLAQIIDDAGVLPGTVSILPMNNSTAEELVRSDLMGVFTFTGSARVGWVLKGISGRKRVLLELGGNAPAIVHFDAEMDLAVDKLAPAGFAAAGQVCIKAQRILVHKDRYTEFREKYVEAAQSLSVGDPANPETVVGPLIDSKSADRVMEWIAEAVSAGATVLCGNRREGNVIQPTVLENVPPDAKCLKDEIFGPVVVLERYNNIDDAIAMANATVYGLQAALFSYDVRVIERVSTELDYGGIIINDSPMIRVDNYPYGGSKESGLGREGVRYAMEEYTQTKVVIRRR